MPQSQRATSLAQLGAAAEAFALGPAGGAGAVETARRAGVRLLSGRDEVVQGPPDSHGNEHDIWFREMADEARVIKITRGRHALYGISDGPASYLRRWLNSNRLFGDDIRLVGVLPDGRFSGGHGGEAWVHRYLRRRRKIVSLCTLSQCILVISAVIPSLAVNLLS